MRGIKIPKQPYIFEPYIYGGRSGMLLRHIVDSICWMASKLKNMVMTISKLDLFCLPKIHSTFLTIVKEINQFVVLAKIHICRVD